MRKHSILLLTPPQQPEAERERTFSLAKFSLRLTPVATLSDVAVMRVEVRELLVEREAAAGARSTRSARKGVWTNAKPGAASNERHIADTMGDIVVQAFLASSQGTR